MLSKIKQIAVSVADLDASKAFYGEMLGVPLAFEVPGQLVFFDLAGIWLMLSKANEKEPAQPGSVLYRNTKANAPGEKRPVGGVAEVCEEISVLQKKLSSLRKKKFETIEVGHLTVDFHLRKIRIHGKVQIQGGGQRHLCIGTDVACPR